MSAPRKLGILVSCPPDRPGFRHATGIARAALNAGVDVYFYCIDESVLGLSDDRLQSLRPLGLKLYACAYGAQRRGLAVDDRATYAGLTVVNDLICGTDRFLNFN